MACDFKKRFWRFVFVLSHIIGYDAIIPTRKISPPARPANLSVYPLEHMICSSFATRTDKRPLMPPMIKHRIRKCMLPKSFLASCTHVSPDVLVLALLLGGVGG